MVTSTRENEEVKMTKAIKLNYRHSLKTMREQLEKHGEYIYVYGQDGYVVHEIREELDGSRGTRTCGIFYNAKDCAEYINERNGF